MPRILFARLKVKEQEQIAAGTIKSAGFAGTTTGTGASALLPNPDGSCITTIISLCEDPVEIPLFSTVNPVNKNI